jgi:very-short-patch-repair endonuclease/predicted nucleic acid-binding Zn ribbon protein
MKGNCDLIECQVCKQKMSFGRIKRHILIQHKNITVDQYIEKYWSTLPLHQSCEVCKDKIVYKYKTCSKECRSKLEHGQKGKSKPKGFMSEEHKEKISNSHLGKIVTKETKQKISISSKGKTRNKNRVSPMLGKTQSNYQKQKVKERLDTFYKSGGEPWTKTHTHTSETIEKIFAKKPMNKLEKFVSSILDENNIKYYYQFFLKTKEGTCKSYDFKIKNTNILIEIDGDYWHGGPGVNKHFYKLEETKQNDLLKNQLALDTGFNLIRIWESDIYNQPNIIIQKINECI